LAASILQTVDYKELQCYCAGSAYGIASLFEVFDTTNEHKPAEVYRVLLRPRLQAELIKLILDDLDIA
jgi:hypothetical protein